MGTLAKEVVKSFNRQNELCCTNLFTIVCHQFKQDELFETETNGRMVEGHLTDRCINQVYDTKYVLHTFFYRFILYNVYTVPI